MIDQRKSEGAQLNLDQVRAACLEAAQNAYERALSDGLCAEGAFEVAMDAIRSLDLAALASSGPTSTKPVS